MNHFGLLAQSGVCALLIAPLTLAASHSIAAEPPLRFVEVPEGEAASTLRALAEQTGLQILFQPSALEGQTTRPVAGRIRGIDAISQMFDGSNLVATRINPTTVTVSLRNVSRGREVFAAVNADDDKGPDDVAAGPARATEGVNDPTSPPSRDRQLPEILVRGSRSLNVDLARTEDDVQPYVVLQAEEITRSGATDIQSLLRQKLNAASVRQSSSQITGVTTSFSGNSSSVDLRGLGSDETLILINGRRAPSVSLQGNAQQGDLNGIPLSAIERIEVLPSTASGIFGGGATGGVVNIVLKQNYSGIDVTALYSNTLAASAFDRQVSVTGGTAFNEGMTSVMINAAYSDAGVLRIRDRDFSFAARQRTLTNNSAAIYNASAPLLGATTNIHSNTSVLSLKPQYGGTVLPQNFTSVPYGYSGVTSDSGAALVANSGRYNLDLAPTFQGLDRSLVQSPVVKSVFATLRHRFTSRIEMFVEGGASRNASSFMTNNAPQSYVLQANAPNNPFAQAITVSTPGFGFDGESETVIDGRRGVAGLVVSLPADWQMLMEYSWSKSQIESVRSANPLTSGFTSGSVDVIRDTNLFPADFSAYMLPGTYVTPSTATSRNPAIRFGTQLPVNLPGGKPSLALAFEYRKEELSDQAVVVQSNAAYFPDRQQSVGSAYLETRLPIVSSANARPGVKALEFQLAGRSDRYTTIAGNVVSVSLAQWASGQSISGIQHQKTRVSSIDPTVGLRYEPLSGLMIRGSYATGFLPPNVSQLVAALPSTNSISAAFNLRDPRRGNELVLGTVDLSTGGNPDLRPEEAKSWTLGFVVEPASLPSLRLSLDRTRIEKRDNISNLSLNQDMINNELFINGLVTRAQATSQNDPGNFGVGPITGFNLQLLNFAELNVTAYDFTTRYSWELSGLGKLQFTARGTRLMHSQVRVAPASDLTENVRNAGVLQWNASGGLSWAYRGWTAGWETQYYDGYYLGVRGQVNPSQGSATVPGQIYHDVYVEFGSGSHASADGLNARGLLSDITLQLGVRNVLNTPPPIVVTDALGYSYVGDPRMARYYLSLKKSF